MPSSVRLLAVLSILAAGVMLANCTRPAEPTGAQVATAAPQSGGQSPREACAADMRTYCPTAGSDRNKIMSCMRDNAARLTPGCRTALQSAGMLPKQ